MNKIIGLIIIQFFTIGILKAQLINVESKRMQMDTVRIAGEMETSFSYQQNNNEKLSQFNGTGTFQMKTKNLKNVFILLGGLETAKSNIKTMNNSKFIHFRYIRKFTNHFRWETFTQAQSNTVLLLNKRLVFGSGPRFKIINTPKFMLSIGTLYMFENEETLESPAHTHYNHRISSYLSFNFKSTNELYEFSSITYYQPKIDYFNDFRFTNQTTLNIALTKLISLEIGFRYIYDAFPPMGVINDSFCTEIGFKATL